jgi:hypothetical protein
MLTAYLFRSNNHHIIAAALRVVTGCADAAAGMDDWRPSDTPFDDRSGAGLATAFHIAPPEDGWVVAYPNIPLAAPFAAALSRQTRRFTVSIVGERREAWERGHPAVTPDDLPGDILDARYFRDKIVPPVVHWQQWLHLARPAR